MKLTFKVRPSSLIFAQQRITDSSSCLQDLKQQKFTIDAEPSETVSFDFFSQLS